MDTKIFLQGFNGKKSSNTSEGLDVQIKGRRKLLPLNDVAEVVSQYDQYRGEREKCNIIRLTCQVNPICSNVLFNRITEIVKDEGSSAVTFINYSLGKNQVFENVIYKPREMGFWSNGNMRYFSNGTNEREVLAYAMHSTNAIRDTQLSRENVGFVYHCGLDFFNNHLLRSNTFKTVCTYGNDNTVDTAFNTIADLMRDVNGINVIENVYFPTNETSLRGSNYTQRLNLHLYEYDDIMPFEETVNDKLLRRYDGWVGFENKSKIKSYINFGEDEEMEIERPLMNFNGGDFIDMYPSRDLYSFVPKYNNFQRRIEKNWNYCITYPSSSYTPSLSTEPFGDIIETNDGLNSLKAIYFDENIRADNGTTQLVIYSIAKHGLSKGDYVNIYKTFASERYWVQDVSGNVISQFFYNFDEANDELAKLRHEYSARTVCDGSELIEPSGVFSAETSMNNEKILDDAEVVEIVDDYIFTVFNPNTQISNNWVYLDDNERKVNNTITVNDKEYTNRGNYFTISADANAHRYYIINDSYVNFDDNAQNISYKKTYGGIECEYYVRIFSKLPNFKYASGDTSSEYEIYRKRENNETMLSTYQGNEYEFENHISKLAFAKNVYADDIGEIVFTDDIDISNIHDNLGRPLTSLYLTIIKNNKGYKEWYGWRNQLTDWKEAAINREFKNIEFSHCFGPVTCGIKASDESMYDDSVRNIVRINNIGSNVGYNVNRINGNEQDGRAYYSSINSRVSIDNNEIWYETDRHFYGDLCYYDSYNAIERHIQYVKHRFNTAQRELYNKNGGAKYFGSYAYDEIMADDYDTNGYGLELHTVDNCNELREGYYYIPHYEIPIKTFDKLQTVIPDFLTIRQFRREEEDGLYTFVTLQQHFLSDGDKAMLYDTIRDRYYKLIAISGKTDNYRTFTCRVYDEDTDMLRNITYTSGVTRNEIIIDYLSTNVSNGAVSVSDFKLFKMDNLNYPSYARVLRDGTCRIIWRNILSNGFNRSDNSVEEYPFTNGAFYINRRIDLYLRRQDPYGTYRLYDERDIEGNEPNTTEEDNYINEADIEC